jgi:hypothetical protein
VFWVWNQTWRLETSGDTLGNYFVSSNISVVQITRKPMLMELNPLFLLSKMKGTYSRHYDFCEQYFVQRTGITNLPSQLRSNVLYCHV